MLGIFSDIPAIRTSLYSGLQVYTLWVSSYCTVMLYGMWVTVIDHHLGLSGNWYWKLCLPLYFNCGCDVYYEQVRVDRYVILLCDSCFPLWIEFIWCSNKTFGAFVSYVCCIQILSHPPEFDHSNNILCAAHNEASHYDIFSSLLLPIS
jgi:hypothetical protein